MCVVRKSIFHLKRCIFLLLFFIILRSYKNNFLKYNKNYRHNIELKYEIESQQCNCLQTKWLKCPLHWIHHPYSQWIEKNNNETRQKNVFMFTLNIWKKKWIIEEKGEVLCCSCIWNVEAQSFIMFEHNEGDEKKLLLLSSSSFIKKILNWRWHDVLSTLKSSLCSSIFYADFFLSWEIGGFIKFCLVDMIFFAELRNFQL